jgi:hypothetical protein
MVRRVIVAGLEIGVWQRAQGPGVRDTPMGTVRVVMPLVLAQGVYEMELVPDQHSIE